MNSPLANLSPSCKRALNARVVQVHAYMLRHKLSYDDLCLVGGDDLESPDPSRQEKARRVQSCWQLMATLSVRFGDLALATEQ